MAVSLCIRISIVPGANMQRKTMVAMAALGWMMMAGAMLQAQAPGAAPQGDSAQQGEREGRAAFAGMQRVTGEVTGVAGATLTVKTEDGATMQIVTTDNTRVMKGRGNTVKITDLKPGDGVMAAGNLDAPNKTLHAAIVFAQDAAQIKAMRENLGKTYIVGKVTAVDLDNAKMTVERPDHVTQTIGFDETTSFRKGGRGGMGRTGAGGATGSGATGSGAVGSAPAEGGESITLADVKVGDTVRGAGSVKNGTFVPTQLVVGTPGQGGHRRADGTAGAATAAPTGPQ
jgi:hypothetical protein